MYEKQPKFNKTWRLNKYIYTYKLGFKLANINK